VAAGERADPRQVANVHFAFRANGPLAFPPSADLRLFETGGRLSRVVALAEALDGLLRPVRVTAEATEAARAASIVPQAPVRMAAGT
jgi:hypothetical protein